jgi:hypothetical protein
VFDVGPLGGYQIISCEIPVQEIVRGRSPAWRSQTAPGFSAGTSADEMRRFPKPGPGVTRSVWTDVSCLTLLVGDGDAGGH